MSQLYLFARIAGTGVALCTDEVEAVVRLAGLTPVPGAPDHVAGLSALRSRVLTILDAATLICGRQTGDPAAGPDRHAIVCDISGHSYGIMVDGVDDIHTVESPVQPLCGRIDPAWQPYAKGVIDHEGRSHFVLSVGGFLEAFVPAQAA